ncbi:pilus assembly PilX family protein [Crenobacter cavernae]|uniref:Pilus assembly protein n=1 Tax=Crenobacter cavernae TaxID=2290923 RepID=A0A345Y9Y1_9NEIS|nr:PilX N-terminal domain-containing pilus assembly protein [Crenobacter cavernae]AXK40733.1 hypothetical protein DWG20_15630 [Crenobacter cavernae]
MKPRRHERVHGRRRQRGVTLLVALVFLAIIALLGASAAYNSSIQERMGGNTRNRDLAFQAAEKALKDAEDTLTAWRSQVPATPNQIRNGLVNCTQSSSPQPATDCFYHANDLAYWQSASYWSTDGQYRTPSQDLDQAAAQPRYVVEKMPSAGLTDYYRVTARGVGKDSGAVVILQAMYRYEP